VIVAAVSTGDLLSAESIVLALVSGLFALWYGEIQSAFHLEKKSRRADRDPEIKMLTRTLWRRAVPLALLTTAAAGVFAPNSVQLLRRAGPLFHGHLPPYDPIAVSVVGVNIGLVVVTLYAGVLAACLAVRRNSFRRVAEEGEHNSLPGQRKTIPAAVFWSACLILAASVGANIWLALSGNETGGPAKPGTHPHIPWLESAIKQLKSLPVHKWDRTKYERSAFGSGWRRVRGCTIRNAVLKRDLTAVDLGPGSKCRAQVKSGILPDPYTGQTIHYSWKEPTAVPIDHIVALKNAWLTGADRWTRARRRDFYNDTTELLAVDPRQNRNKSDHDAFEWVVPANPAYRCAYIAEQVKIKTRYKLWVTQKEGARMKAVLSDCPSHSARPLSP
jgi:hypothetical protein